RRHGVLALVGDPIRVLVGSEPGSQFARVDQAVGVAVCRRTGDVCDRRVDPGSARAGLRIDGDGTLESSRDRAVGLARCVEGCRRYHQRELRLAALSVDARVDHDDGGEHRIELEGQRLKGAVEVASHGARQEDISRGERCLGHGP
ncbi:MAG: hypothetical protein ACK56I_28040, partial [bacterium]